MNRLFAPAVETAATRASSPPAWAPHPSRHVPSCGAWGAAAGQLGAFRCREFIRRVSEGGVGIGGESPEQACRD